MRSSVYLVICLILLNSCATLPDVAEGVEINEYKKITVGWGPEDFELDPSGVTEYPRILVACDERREVKTQGEIWEVDLTTFESRKLPIEFKDSTTVFHPVGISIYKNYLFVINERKKGDHIIRFLIEDDRVVEDTTFSEGLIGNCNDIFAVSENEFYYSDFKEIGGSVVHYFEGEWEKKVKHLRYANGVYVLGDVLYITTSLQHKVFAYDLLTEEKVVIGKIKGGDNLAYDGTNFYTTSHPSFGKFIKHYKNIVKISPSVAYEISLNENRVIYSNAGEQISAASTAWRYEDFLILGQVFDNFLWVGKIESDN